jgi:3-methyladenine DNA glycosylase AlkC
MLTDDCPHPDTSEKPHPPPSPRPPPIFLHGVINYTEMIQSLTEVVAEEQFLTKSLANNVIKLACTTPDTYRAIIKHCKEQNIYYHTYQLKEERAFRVVIKHLHHTADLDDIKNELHILGHDVRNIINVRHRQTK